MAAINYLHNSSRRYKVGALVSSRDGRNFVIENINTKARQVILAGAIGDFHYYCDDEFRNAVASGELSLETSVMPESEIDKNKKTRALTITEEQAKQERLAYISVVAESFGEASWQKIYEEILRRFSTKYQVPSRRTIERYWRVYKESYSVTCLAPRFSSRGVHRSLSFDPLVEEIILSQIEIKYCNNSKFSIQDIVNEINIACDKKSREISRYLGGVSRRTVSRFIHSLSLKKLKGRLSPRTFRSIAREALRYLDVKEPFERVEMDSTTLDIFVVDNAGNVIGSPTLYIMIDSATSIIVGMFLTIQKPSQVALMQTIQFAFKEKGENFRKKYQLKTAWPAPADLRTLVLDNGSDCHGPMVVQGARYLGITLEYCAVGAPYQKPFVERFFGTLNTGLILKLPGAKKSLDKREMYALETAKAEACLTIEDLDKKIIQWICDVYHHRRNDRLSEKYDCECSPLKALSILSDQYPIFPPPSPDEFIEACRHYLEVPLNVTREGINYQRQFFTNEFVSRLYKTNSKRTVNVTINPLDCRSIFVFDEDSKSWINVPNKKPSMPAISFEQAKENRKRLYKSDHEMAGEAHVLAAHEMLEEANAKKRRKGKIGDNNRAQREIEKAQAALQDSAPVVMSQPVGSGQITPSSTPSTPFRRKK